MTNYILLFLAGLAYLIFGTATAVVAVVTVALGIALVLYVLGARALAKQQGELAEQAQELAESLGLSGNEDYVPRQDPGTGIVPADEIDKAERLNGNSSRPVN